MSSLQYNPKQLLEQIDDVPVRLVQQLIHAGYDAYIVGGAIRDLLLGHTPKDYDISTSATPEQVRKVFGRRRCRIIGRRFRLAHVYSNGEIYEVSTFRRKPTVNERHGKKDDSPEIMIWNDNCYGSLQDDAGRRDFTCNSLYLDAARSGSIIDMHNGLEDIRNGIVRCIGNPEERMEEDPVRMLRALKLVALCDFKLEAGLEKAIRKLSQSITLSSPARLFEELLKILNSPHADSILTTFHHYGFLRYYWPMMDSSWDDQEGLLALHLLKLRGQAMLSGRYSDSRGLALSTICTPYMMTALNPASPEKFWTGGLQSNETAKQVINVLFEGFMVPRVLSFRMLTIIGMIPGLIKKPVRQKYLANREYRYTRAILALIVEAFGWGDMNLLQDLPELSPVRQFSDDLDDTEFADDEDAGHPSDEAGVNPSEAEASSGNPNPAPLPPPPAAQTGSSKAAPSPRVTFESAPPLEAEVSQNGLLSFTAGKKSGVLDNNANVSEHLEIKKKRNHRRRTASKANRRQATDTGSKKQ